MGEPLPSLRLPPHGLERYLLPALIAGGGYLAHLLTRSGALSACVIGCVVISAGYDVAAMLIAFFLAGSMATKVQQRDKEAAMPYPETEHEAELRASKAGAAEGAGGGVARPKRVEVQAAARRGRDMSQVLATGLVPALICATRAWFPALSPRLVSGGGWELAFLGSSPSGTPLRQPWFLAYLAFVATCCGDTLASEIGMLARQTPIMMWRRARVCRGVDGGMTLLGTAASCLGGALIGAFGGSAFDVYLGAIYGCIGSLFDSLLGAVLQSSQYAHACPKKADDPQGASGSRDGFVDATGVSRAPLPLTPATWKHLNNLVNVLSSLMAAALALAVQHLRIERGVDLLPLLALFCLMLLLTVAPGIKSAGAVAASAAILLAWLAVFARDSVELGGGGVLLLLSYTFWRMR